LRMNVLDLLETFLKNSLQLYKKRNNKSVDRNVCDIYSCTGMCLMEQNKCSQSLVYLQTAMHKFQAVPFYTGKNLDIAKAFQTTALCYLKINQFAKSFENFQNAMNELEKVTVSEESNRRLSALHNDIGICFIEICEYKKAWKHLLTSMKIKSSLD